MKLTEQQEHTIAQWKERTKDAFDTIALLCSLFAGYILFDVLGRSAGSIEAMMATSPNDLLFILCLAIVPHVAASSVGRLLDR